MDKTRDRFDHHLPYEIRMISLTYAWLRDVKPYTDQLLANVFIEAFCIHARVLMEFLAVHGRKFTKENYAPPERGEGTVFENFRAPLNKQIAHLDADGRYIDPSKKIGANMQLELNNWLSDELKRFNDALKEEYASPVLPKIPKFRTAGSAPTTTTTSTMMSTFSNTI